MELIRKSPPENISTLPQTPQTPTECFLIGYSWSKTLL